MIGEIKRDFEIGKPKHYAKYISHACVNCGKERWVRLLHGKPTVERCYSCANYGNNNPMFGKRGETCPSWSGGEILWKGYIYIYKPDHPHANGQGYIRRANLVLEEKLGRFLKDGHFAHHINEVKLDDSPENLEELESIKHAVLHHKKV